jgi:hypothetical protein
MLVFNICFSASSYSRFDFPDRFHAPPGKIELAQALPLGVCQAWHDIC